MALEFTNKQGDIYYIKSKLTKKGNTTYYATKKRGKDCLDSMPEGYEIFEVPDTSTMYIRRKKESAFDAKEVGLVEAVLKKNEAIADFQLDIVGNLMKIYVAETDNFERLKSIMKDTFASSKSMDMVKKLMRYEEKMRIIKDKEGEYGFQRYCYRGSIDDWIWIDGGDDLEHLAETNIQHLGKESYYEL